MCYFSVIGDSLGRGHHSQVEGGLGRDPLRVQSSGEAEMVGGMGTHMVSPGQEHQRHQDLRHTDNR